MPGEFYVETAKIPDAREVPARLRGRRRAAAGQGLRRRNRLDVSLQSKWYRSFYVVDSKPIITGDYLTDAKPNTVPTEGTIVEFTLNNEGGRRFRTRPASTCRTTWRSCSTTA